MSTIQITADTTFLTADQTFAAMFGSNAVNSNVTADMTAFNQSVSPSESIGAGRTDISPFSKFSYSDSGAWEDFLLVNSLAHDNYNTAIELAGGQPINYPILDVGDTKEAKDDWLQTHNLMHKNLAATVGLPTVPDLADVEVHDDVQFYDWLQLHMQQHQLLDAALNL